MDRGSDQMCYVFMMRVLSDTGAGQPVVLIITRRAVALAKKRTRRILSAAKKHRSENAGQGIYDLVHPKPRPPHGALKDTTSGFYL